jgi:transcription-repair coupling factor (superfamily II helicase)
MPAKAAPPSVLGPSATRRRNRWGQLYGAASALAIAEFAAARGGPVLLIVPDPRDADEFVETLGFFAGDDLEIVLFPDSETLPYDAFSPHPDLTSRRLAAMSRLPRLRRGIVVVALSTLLQRLPPAAWVAGSSLSLDRGGRLDLDAFREDLAAAGYVAVSQVSEHGEYAIRGSIVDVFPMGADDPYRIDLFDDEIDSIRSFDPETQRSLETLDGVRLMPAREFPFDGPAREAFRERFRQRFPDNLNRVQVYLDVADGNASGGIEYYLPMFFDATDDLFAYLPAETTVVTVRDALNAAQPVWQGVLDRFDQLSHDIERPCLPPEELFLAPADLEARLAGLPLVEIQGFELPGDGDNLATAVLPPLQMAHRTPEPARPLLDFVERFSGRILFTAESPGRREVLAELLGARGIRPTTVSGWRDFLAGVDRIALAVAPLAEGTVLAAAEIAIIPESALYGERARQRRRRSRRERDPESLVRQLTDLAIGAPVIHEEHGVGRYLGLETLSAGGHTGEFLTLEYAGGDRLYVPVQSLDLISRYTGTSPETAPLHRLGSDQWERARKRAAKRARDVAAELLDVYARRAAREGRVLRCAEPEYLAFCEGFPFDETPDQAEAIDAVLEDLGKQQPMDRVVCGDVGFGKTEVALRAAFATVQAGAQVAMLVPTTLLAQQHCQTFSDRFADTPIRVEVLSRFRSTADARRVRECLASGGVDIVIGTHRLLQQDVRFEDLGLVIIDEEHRFGVRHKERLRQLRAEVDVLTLTATPIPRTLNMAMGGLRDLSIIATPPSERLAVKTFVTQWQNALIREACLREIRRGGQVYFLHNKVETIEKAAGRLEALVPEARIRIAHGQLRERELEQIMLDFYHRRFNVLVCTTIIESGIDVPTANTIVIDRADHLGLAQLHQLRGRVGRSHHRAYAYLVTPPPKLMTADAVKRLEAIESLEQLGAGFMLATHDLEIRGAGELLGEDQSGQIQEVGFSMYMQLLERAVRSLKAGEEPDLDGPLHQGTEVEIGVVALLPEDYVPDVHLRLVLYKRIASAADEAELRDLQVEFIDRFGLLPEPAGMLFRIAELRLKASALGIRRVDAGPRGGHLLFANTPNVDPARIIRLIQSQPRVFRLDGQHKLRFNRPSVGVEERLQQLHDLLDELGRPAEAATGS